MRRLLPLAVLAAGCRASLPPPLPKPFAYPMTAPGKAVLELERDRDRHLASADAWMYWQALAQYRAQAGDYDGALAAWDRPGGEGKSPAPALEGFGPEDAAAVVWREAERRQAVFLNEAHHVPLHREFTRSLLAGLRERGYRYFAAEAFSPDAPERAAGGVPVRALGGYASEPRFAALVSEALRLGFVLVPYEDETGPCADPPGDANFCANRRDRAMAENLKARVFDRDPRARLVVHAGFDHVRKDGRPGWRTMAAVFKEVTGLDPLSVDQVELTGRSAPAFDSPAYKALLDAFKPEGPVIVSREDGRGLLLEGHEGAFDFHVLHPRPATLHGRPAWVYAGRRAVELGPGACPAFPCVVEVYREGAEPAEEPPADAVIVRGAGPLPRLAVPPGAWFTRALGPDGGVAVGTAFDAP